MNLMTDRVTGDTRRRYDRIAPFFDGMEWCVERAAFQFWRKLLWSHLAKGRILEVGVGTGKNMPYYPTEAHITAIDLSAQMLERARKRAENLNISVDLQQMDVQKLEFQDNTFDSAVATFVFCSVPIPLKGLQELKRVVRPKGEVWLLEHVRIDKPIIGSLMDVVNPLVVRAIGANINRRTVRNVHKAGLEIVGVELLSGELVKLIQAHA